MKKVLLITLIASISLLSIGCGCEKKEKKKEEKTEIKVNSEENVVKDQEVETFKMTNTSLTYDGKMSTLLTDVTNISQNKEMLKSFNIIVKDKDGNEIITLLGYIGEEIEPGEIRTITSGTDMDLSKAASIEYTINK